MLNDRPFLFQWGPGEFFPMSQIVNITIKEDVTGKDMTVRLVDGTLLYTMTTATMQHLLSLFTIV